MDRIFDTKVQLLKYKVLKSIIKRAYEGGLDKAMYEIPKEIVPGPKSDMRCCIYKERAVLEERVRMAMGGDESNPNVIEAVPVACDECPVESYFITGACRGCINHKCMEVCPKGAITIEGKHAVMNRNACIECGKCAKACPYNAIIEYTRPCVKACKINALKINADKTAVIDNDKCVMCGACVYSCPFGAIMDKSYVLDLVKILQDAAASKIAADATASAQLVEVNAQVVAANAQVVAASAQTATASPQVVAANAQVSSSEEQKVYAVIAPAIVSQFKYAKIEQIVEGIKKLGFFQVVEAALGADITLSKELEELALLQEGEKLTTSCCPSFVMYVEKHFPKLVKYISHSPSPMIETARLIKTTNPNAKVVFIGPCSSKKYEYKLSKTGGAVDCVISFEELQAFFDARGIDVSTLPSSPLNNASFYGRIFAKSGGITQGVNDIKAKRDIKNICPLALNGLEQIKTAMLKMNVGKLPENFIEGMACVGGCINGALCLSHGDKNVVDVDKYGQAAMEKDIDNSVKLYQLTVESVKEQGAKQ